jgi:hypothetical protein
MILLLYKLSEVSEYLFTISCYGSNSFSFLYTSLYVSGVRHSIFAGLKIHEQCGDVASRYVLDHYHDWLLGGEGATVVIDLHPDGNMTPSPVKNGMRKKTQKKVLCIVDTSRMSVCIWARIIHVLYHFFFMFSL